MGSRPSGAHVLVLSLPDGLINAARAGEVEEIDKLRLKIEIEKLITVELSARDWSFCPAELLAE